MDEKKKKQASKKTEDTKNCKETNESKKHKDIDDLIFADEYIKTHSEK